MEKWIIDSAMVISPSRNRCASKAAPRHSSAGSNEAGMATSRRDLVAPATVNVGTAASFSETDVSGIRRACAPSSAPPVSLHNFGACGGQRMAARSAPPPGPWRATRVWVSTAPARGSRFESPGSQRPKLDLLFFLKGSTRLVNMHHAFCSAPNLLRRSVHT